MSIGQNIKQVREARDISLTELSRRMEVDPSSIQRWEKDAVSPTWNTLERIADGIGVSVYDLVVETTGGGHTITGLTAREYNFLVYLISDQKTFSAIRDLFEMFREMPPSVLSRLWKNMAQIIKIAERPMA